MLITKVAYLNRAVKSACVIATAILSGCSQPVSADFLLKNGDVYIGDGSKGVRADVAIKDDVIIFVGTSSGHIDAAKTIDVGGQIVAPGFIDPHTHSLEDLRSDTASVRQNSNYRLQGVTTVFNGNDGGGDPDIAQLSNALLSNGIGTNTALYAGHGAIRQRVMGRAGRAPTDAELTQMKSWVAREMDEGALGLSTGLFYVPGSFSNTDEVVELAKVAALSGGIYDSHIRDESTYNIGVEAAIDEAIDVGRRAQIPVHIAHIKALGIDVWGKSGSIIEAVARARAEGLQVTADQYPWLASGTSISAALMPREIKDGSQDLYLARLSDPDLREKLIVDVTENLRLRGGPTAILITKGRDEWQGKTLDQIAEAAALSPPEMAIEIARNGNASIASFNMDQGDVVNFMTQDWVMTSSDGSTGHPRKFASFPKKFDTYVRDQQALSIQDFLYRSSGFAADTFRLCGRGYIKTGYKADLVVFDPAAFRPRADFQEPERLSEGVDYLFVNGKMAVESGNSLPILSGKVLTPCPSNDTPD